MEKRGYFETGIMNAKEAENELLKTRVDKKQKPPLITFKPFFGNTMLAVSGLI